MTQPSLFPSQVDFQTLREGKTECPCCGRLMRAYCKTLDKRLLLLLDDIVRHLDGKNVPFNPQIVWNNAHREIADHNKLHYWGIIAKVEKRTGWWRITQFGWRFYYNREATEKRLWVFNDTVVMRDESEMVTASKLDDRWQSCRMDWAMDYAPVPEAALPKSDSLSS